MIGNSNPSAAQHLGFYIPYIPSYVPPDHYSNSQVNKYSEIAEKSYKNNGTKIYLSGSSQRDNSLVALERWIMKKNIWCFQSCLTILCVIASNYKFKTHLFLLKWVEV